jgi:hypothetical protein
MRFLRFALRLSFFLVAETLLWFVASFGSHLGLDRASEALVQHGRLVDWLWGRNARQGDIERLGHHSDERIWVRG